MSAGLKNIRNNNLKELPVFQAKASDTSGKMAGNIIYAQDKICVNELCKLREEGTDSL